MDKKSLMFIVKIVTSSLLLALLFLHTSLFSVATILYTHYNTKIIFLVLALLMVAMCITVIRWKILLPEVRFLTLFIYSCVGQFYSIVLPGQLTGDVVKVARMNANVPLGVARITSSVVLDKAIGIVSLLFVAYMGLLFTTISERVQLLSIVSTLLVMSISLLTVCTYRVQFVSTLLSTISVPKFLMPVRVFALSAIASLQACLRGPSILLYSFVLAVFYQVISISITYVLAHALGIQVSWTDWFWIFGIVSLAAILPVTVAGIGVREGVIVYYLVQLGEPYDMAIALSFSVLGTQLLFAVIGGFLEFSVLAGLKNSFGKGA